MRGTGGQLEEQHPWKVRERNPGTSKDVGLSQEAGWEGRGRG